MEKEPVIAEIEPVIAIRCQRSSRPTLYPRPQLTRSDLRKHFWHISQLKKSNTSCRYVSESSLPFAVRNHLFDRTGICANKILPFNRCCISIYWYKPRPHTCLKIFSNNESICFVDKNKKKRKRTLSNKPRGSSKRNSRKLWFLGCNEITTSQQSENYSHRALAMGEWIMLGKILVESNLPELERTLFPCQYSIESAAVNPQTNAMIS